MTRIYKLAALAVMVALASTQLTATAEADPRASSQAAARATATQAQAARAQAARAQAARAQAARMKAMQARQAQAARAGMAAAMVTAATLAATDAGECSPYLAKWMMTRSPAWKAAYDACMDD